MATRFIHQDLSVKSVGKDVAGFGVDTNGVLRVARGGSFMGALSTDPEGEPVPVRRVITGKTASFTLVKADSGAVVPLNSTSITVTLPEAEAGLEFTFVIRGVSTAGVGYDLAPASGDKFHIMEATANSTLRVLAAYDSTGDVIQLVGDADGWYVLASIDATNASAALDLI